jgi:putative RecB family exonuclease
MKVYSHSKLSSFEQCPQKYKFHYIDKIIIIEKNIEAFLGNTIHATLEWLYLEVKQGRLPPLDDVILYYTYTWKQAYNEKEIILRKLTELDYHDKGIRFLIDYYMKHKPFDDNTLEVEKEISLIVDENKEYQIRGFIDRLVYNLKTCEYEIHDYKTSESAPSQEKIDNDRQLALYSIAIKQMFGKDKEVLLVWHYLAFNKRVHSKRTNEELEELKKQVFDLIKTIESTKNFHPYISKLCDWCEYQNICPAWDNSPDFKEMQKKIEEF